MGYLNEEVNSLKKEDCACELLAVNPKSKMILRERGIPSDDKIEANPYAGPDWKFKILSPVKSGKWLQEMYFGGKNEKNVTEIRTFLKQFICTAKRITKTTFLLDPKYA